MTISKYIPIVTIGIVALLVLLYGFAHTAKADDRSGGLESHVATSSSIVVGPQSVTTVFASTQISTLVGLCATRVISTVSSPIMLSFSGDIAPSGTIGHVQAASTSIAYSSATYGCGAITAYGFSSTTITKTETRW